MDYTVLIERALLGFRLADGRSVTRRAVIDVPVDTSVVSGLRLPYDPDFFEPTCSQEQNEGGVADALTEAFETYDIKPQLNQDEDNAEDLTVVVVFLAVGDQPLAVPTKFRTHHHIGNCNEDHPGLCRSGCSGFPVTMRWNRTHSETRGQDYLAVFEASPE